MRPKYDTVYRHFRNLEDDADAFRLAAIDLIAVAVKKSDGLVGRDIHVDGTEAETNARVYHACEPDNCPRNQARGRSPLAKAPTTLAHEERHKEDADVPGEPKNLEVKETTKVSKGRLFKLSNGCWYSTSDPTAGLRAYGGSRGRPRKSFWLGFNNLKAVDHYTGAVLATFTVPANINEEKAYPLLLNRLIENSGQTPRAVVGDRGFSRSEVFETNTKAGIASVFPWRKHSTREDRDLAGTDHHDQHGIPLCQKCHGPGRFVRFQPGEKPRLWFECENGCGPGSVVCSKGWRYLLPLWRTEEAYIALSHSHSQYENAHWRWRDQWLVGPDNPSNRPRRRGINCHQLRAEAALLLEWLSVCWREGWIDGRRRNSEKSFKRHAQLHLERLLRSRVKKGLHLPPVARIDRPRSRTG
jgi:hypothetical protein